MSSKSRGKVGRHFGIAVGPAHSSRRADGRKWPLCAPISIFSLRRRPPRRCDSSSRHATPLPATLQLAGSTRLSFSYRARVAGRRGEKIRLQHRHIRKFLQEISGWTEFNTFLAPSSVPLHSFLTAFPLPHNSPNSATPSFLFFSS